MAKIFLPFGEFALHLQTGSGRIEGETRVATREGVQEMPVIQSDRRGGYTVMDNHHLRDRELSLKAKGLLSQMLSLPPQWRFTVAGMAAINRECKDTIRRIFQELEARGYLVRCQTVTEGRFGESEYLIYERPVEQAQEQLEEPAREGTEEKTPTEHPPAKKRETKKSSTKISPTKNSPTKKSSTKNATQLKKEERKKEKTMPEGRKERSSQEEEALRLEKEKFFENLEYEALFWEFPRQGELIREMGSVLWDTLQSRGDRVRVGGEELSRSRVVGRLRGLGPDHLRYVLRRVTETGSTVGNMRQYLLTSLYNAPLTMENDEVQDLGELLGNFWNG